MGHGNIRVLEKHLRNNRVPREHLGLVDEVLGLLYWTTGYGYFMRNSFKEARSLFLRGMRYRRAHKAQLIYWCACWLPLQFVEAIRWIKRGYWDHRGPRGADSRS